MILIAGILLEEGERVRFFFVVLMLLNLNKASIGEG